MKSIAISNTNAEEIADYVDGITKKQLWNQWTEYRALKKHLDLLEKYLKSRLQRELGDKDSLIFNGDAGVYWQRQSKKEISPISVMKIIDNDDVALELFKVDMTKAKELKEDGTITKEQYIELEESAVIVGEVKKLMTGKIKVSL